MKTVLRDHENNLESLILVGSLSNGSYIEGVGRDIDLIIVLKDNAGEAVKDKIINQIELTEAEFNYDVPIARTIYRLCELKRPFKRDISLSLENKHLIEVTIELQRIHESGILIYGRNIIKELPVPSREEVKYFDELGKRWSRDELCKSPEVKEMLKNPPDNIIMQVIITNAFRHYYYSTGKACSNKLDIAHRMSKDVPNYRFQAALHIAVKYKTHPNNKPLHDEYDEMKKGYEELVKWIDSEAVDSVPLL